MISGTALVIVSAYVLLTALLLLVLIVLPLKTPFKLIVTLAASGAYIVMFYATQSILGWSAPVALPEKFQILWTRVLEPNARLGRDGAVHLWAEALDEHNIPSGVPRAYLLPYTESLAGRIATVQSEIKQGHPQAGFAAALLRGGGPQGATVRNISGGVGSGGDASSGGLLAPTTVGGQSTALDLVSLPPPMLPPKDDP